MSESIVNFDQAFATVQALQAEVFRTVNMPEADLQATLGALTMGHVLFEGVPGTGKTLLGRSLAAAMGGVFKRVQGTPDVMPTDITGTDVYNPANQGFDFREGPIFSQVFLFDEINRASTKSQSALLEAMQEGQVTVGGETRTLPTPFMVLATQNPREIGQGVNPLTKASLDRFAVGIHMPEHDANDMIDVDHLNGMGHTPTDVVDQSDIIALKKSVREVVVSEELKRTTANLVVAARSQEEIDKEETVLGGSRPFMNIRDLARFMALTAKRQNVVLEDIQFAARYVLPHRMEVNGKAADAGVTTRDLVDHVIKVTR